MRSRYNIIENDKLGLKNTINENTEHSIKFDVFITIAQNCIFNHFYHQLLYIKIIVLYRNRNRPTQYYYLL